MESKDVKMESKHFNRESKGMNEIVNIINNIIFTLRRNSTFSLFNSYVPNKDTETELTERIKFKLKETDLIRNFTLCKLALIGNSTDVDGLYPFLEIIKSGSLTGSVTLLAIEGISFLIDTLSYDALCGRLKELVDAVTKCKFEATDSLNDEIVLANILQLLQKIIIKFSGILEVKAILDILQVSLGMYFQTRISEFLKREALSTLAKLVTEIPFKSSYILEILKVIANLLDMENRNNIDSVHRNLGLYLLQIVMDQNGKEISALITTLKSTKRLDRKSFILQETKESVNVSDLQGQKIQLKHFVIQDENVNEEMIKDLIGNDICKAAFQLIQAYDLSFNSPPSWPIVSLIHQALKALSSLFRTNRMHLKYQMDWFMMWCINIVDSGLVCWNIEDWMGPINNSQTVQNETLPQKRDILIGEIREMLVLDDTFLLDLYVNYDGDMDMENNLFDVLTRFLAKHSFPDATYGGPVSSLVHQALCIDSLLVFLTQVVQRSTLKGGILDQLPSNSFLVSNRTRKKVLIEGTMMFNQSPKKGIPFLQADASNIASFLVENAFVDKKLLGLYLAKPDNQEILKEFVNRLGFKGKRIDEALRTMLERFRLPGESQQIERILDAFAESFYADMSEENAPIENASVTCVLAYSIIMLHTDQHNPQVRRRMTFEDYSKNLRGCNEGKDFDVNFLQEIYDAIKGREILMPEEHGGHVGFSHLWKEIQASSDAYHPLTMIPSGYSHYDSDIFGIVWGPILASLFYSFDSAEDGIIFEKAVIGIKHCAQIAYAYKLSDVLDYIISSLAQVGGLNVDYRIRPSGSFADSSSTSQPFRMPNDIAIEMGRNFNQRFACYLMFSFVFTYPSVLKESWNYVMKAYIFLIENDLLQEDLKIIEDLKGEKFKMALLVDKKVLTAVDVENSPRKETGLLSTLTQLLSLSSAEEESVQLEKAKYVSLARECIQKCQLGQISLISRSIDDTCIILLMKAIMYSSFKVDSPTTPINEIGTVKSPVMNEDVKLSNASPFMLNIMTEVVLANIYRFELIAQTYIDYLIKVSEILTDQIILVRCYAISVFKISRELNKENIPDIGRVFGLLSQIELSKFPFFIDQIIAGLSQILQKSTSWLDSDPNASATVFNILSIATMLPLVAESSFEVTCLVLDSKSIRKEKYGECVDLLLNYPTAAASFSGGSTARVASGALADSESKYILHTYNRYQSFLNVSIKALNRLYDFRSDIPEWVLDASSSKRAFFEFWLPILSGLSQQCYHPVREIRQHAFSLLEKVILSKELNLYNDCSEIWISCFDSVIFPLIDELVKINGVGETSSRSFALMCRLLLHISQTIMQSKELLNFWPRFLSCIKNYLVVSDQDLKEAARESLKNLLLVLSTHHLFGPGPKESQETDLNAESPNVTLIIWTNTWQELDQVLPNFRQELFPGD